MKKRPMTRVNLDRAISRLVNDDPLRTVDLRMSLANAIVGQFLPDGVVKGGTSLKFRFGSGTTRYTMDLDVARQSSLDDFLKLLNECMALGWEGFGGEVVLLSQARATGVPFDYVMQPCQVKLSYQGRSWCSVRLEIGHNEIGDADEADKVPIPDDLANTFKALCFPVPNAIPLMRLPYQIAQKLHGATGVVSKRAHDLIDLQLILQNADDLDYAELREICHRLFAYRKCQDWPPKVRPMDGWREIYERQRMALNVLPNLDDAIAWANDLISRIEDA